MPIFLFIPEVEVLLGDLEVIVVLAYVCHTLAFEFGDAFGMKHQLLQFVKNTIVSGGYVDDGA